MTDAAVIWNLPTLREYLAANEATLGLTRQSWSSMETDYHFVGKPEQSFRVYAESARGKIVNFVNISVSQPPNKIPDWLDDLLSTYTAVVAKWATSGDYQNVVRYVYRMPKA